MLDFKNLPCLLGHLEEHAAEYAGAYIISSLFEVVYNHKIAEGAEKEAEEALWERYAFCLEFEDGDIANWCGHITQRFDDRIYLYLIQRLMDSSQPVLKARYAHLLWCSPRKKIDHARIAIDSYLSMVKEYEHWDKVAPEKRLGLQITKPIRNAYALAIRTKYHISETKTEMLRLIKHFNFGSNWSFRVRQELIKVALNDKKHFKNEELAGFQDVCWRLIKTGMRSKNEGQVQDTIDIIDLGQQIDQRIKQESYNWYLAKAKCCEKKIQMREEGDLAVPSFCLEAIENYRKAGKETKVRELEREYPKLAASCRLACIKVTVDMTQTVRQAQNLAKEVAELSPQEVVHYLIHQSELLPRYDRISKMIQSDAVEPFLMDAVSSVIDDRGHLKEYSATQEEREKREILRIFGQELDLHYLPVMHEVILKAIQQEKLSASILRDYFNERSWLGKDLKGQSPTRDMYRYRLWDILEPSLVGYFEKTRQWQLGHTSEPNLILEIDSLTLKFEGLLRDLLRLDDVPTFKQKGQGDGLAEERYIGNLLDKHKDAMKRLFSQDDLLFLQFMFSEASGYDLRNRIAHCLMLAKDYSIDYMHLLLLALLRFSKYDLIQMDELIVSSQGDKFHWASCVTVRKIEPKNRITLISVEASQRERYKPCCLCKPIQSESKQDLGKDKHGRQKVLIIRL